MADFKLTMVTHACIKVEGEFGALLCDPWFLNEPVFDFTTWKYPAAVLSPEEVVEGVTHVFISHTHDDHFHIPSMDHLPRDVQWVLPEYSWRPGLRSQLVERTLRDMGFFKIRKMLPFETVEIGPGARITPVPAAATKPQDWENSGLVIEVDGVRLLNMNDNPSDEDLYAEVNRRFDHFDVVLVQYAGVSTWPGRFRMTEPEMREAVANKLTSFAEQKRAVELLNTDHIVPFAGDFCWLDDRLFHCNWASRATPHLFEDWLRTNYPDKDVSLLIMYPSDTWTPGSGMVRNHPEIDWDNYLDDIRRLKERFQNKVDAINAWAAASDKDGLKARTQAYMANLEKWADDSGIDFRASIRMAIEGGSSNFSFVMMASPEEGFLVLWDHDGETDQTCYVPEDIWASIMEAKMMMCTLGWAGEIEQAPEFRKDMADFWWWIEFNADFGNRVPQTITNIEQHPWLTERVRPQLGVFGE